MLPAADAALFLVLFTPRRRVVHVCNQRNETRTWNLRLLLRDFNFTASLKPQFYVSFCIWLGSHTRGLPPGVVHRDMKQEVSHPDKTSGDLTHPGGGGGGRRSRAPVWFRSGLDVFGQILCSCN